MNLNNNQNQNLNSQQSNQGTTNNQSNNQPSGILMKLVGSCLPVIMESFMGQQMPFSNNTDMQLVLSQVIALQQQIITSQQALNQRLIQLESNATHQFTNLTQQVQSIKSIRLTHDRERKQIDYHLQPEEEK